MSGETSTVNFNSVAQVRFLKTQIDAICEKKDEKVRVLINSRPDLPAAFGLEDLNGFLSNFGLNISAADLKPVLDIFGIDAENLKLELTKAFYTGYLAGASEGDASEFAFRIKINNNIVEKEEHSSIFTFDSLSFSVWNSTNPNILKEMNLMSIDDILKNT